MNRSAVIDALKALASQVIVLHHLSLYSPMAEWISAAWPTLVEFTQEEGRLAVQPFLVISGYLAAQSLSQRAGDALGSLVWQRYLRLAPQLLLALALVVGATWLVGDALAQHDWLSPLPSTGVFLAHLLLLQDVLGIPSMSAGAWYVSIDLQLFCLLALLTRLVAGQRPLARSRAPAVMAVATAASILVFSHHPDLEVWAPYFLSAYGLGVLVAWSKASERARSCLGLVVLLVLLDWALDPRAKPLVALGTAMALQRLSGLRWGMAQQVLGRAVRWLSDLSYSVFVCHFAVIILVSGVWEKLALQGVGLAVLGTAVAWGACLAMGLGVQTLSDRWMRRGASGLRTAR